LNEQKEQKIGAMAKFDGDNKKKTKKKKKKKKKKG